MRAIPVIRCTDVKRSLAFYTGFWILRRNTPRKVIQIGWLIWCKAMRRFSYRSMRAMAHLDARSIFV